MNGVEENNLNVTMDGARQNNRIFHPSAAAGAIAFETKDVADLLDVGDIFGGRASLEYHDSGNTFTPSPALYGESGGFEYLVFGKTSEGDFWMC